MVFFSHQRNLSMEPSKCDISIFDSMVSFGLGSFLSGIVFDRLGPKFNYIIGLLMLASCYGFAGRLESLPAFCLVVGVCGGVGSALVGIVPTQSLIARWFKRQRAAAMSIAYSEQGLVSCFCRPLR